jgi:hypothetical protein
MVLLSAQGMDVAAIAKVAFTSEDRVRDVIRNFNADGFNSLYPEYKGGRPPKFTLAQRREIKKIAKARPADNDLPFSEAQVNVARRLSGPRGRLAMPSIDGLASLVLRRCWEGLQSGGSAVFVQAAVALIRLAHEIEHDAALAERDAARRQMEEWRHGLWIIRNAIVRQYGQDAWAAIAAEVRKLRAAAPQ